ncbi:hypothetical protein ABZ330_21560 [Streptomyces sp. NPDC006172]|uniref:hypothetical protein n=1 Tax=Streptomyces sp. NPDC006172 TaxID=3154470 RepID=UPI0033D04F52
MSARDDLNPFSLALDAQAYRRLADDVLATMANPDRWDLDGDEGWILAQYVKHIAAQLTLASEFRVPLPDGLGGYGEVVVQRESTGSDRWAVTDGALTGLRAWVYPAGWQYVTEVGRAVAFAHDLDDALELAEAVAKIEREQYDARIRAAVDGEKGTRGGSPQQGESTPEPPRPHMLPESSFARARLCERIGGFFRCARIGRETAGAQ